MWSSWQSCGLVHGEFMAQCDCIWGTHLHWWFLIWHPCGALPFKCNPKRIEFQWVSSSSKPVSLAVLTTWRRGVSFYSILIYFMLGKTWYDCPLSWEIGMTTLMPLLHLQQLRTMTSSWRIGSTRTECESPDLAFLDLQDLVLVVFDYDNHVD